MVCSLFVVLFCRMDITQRTNNHLITATITQFNLLSRVYAVPLGSALRFGLGKLANHRDEHIARSNFSSFAIVPSRAGFAVGEVYFIPQHDVEFR